MKLPFEEVWLLNLVERPDRLDKMRKQFDHLGWKDQVQEVKAVIHPFCGIIQQCFNQLKVGFLNSPNAFSCTREHYTLIKSAYLRGINSICIIEDDVSFHKSLELWEDYLCSIPSDWDILRLCSLRGRPEEEKLEKVPNIKWSSVFSGMWGTGCYALSRKGMEYMMKEVESFYQPIDLPLFNYQKNPAIKHYIPNTPLGLCLEDSLKSNINQTSASNLYFKDLKNIKIEDYKI